VQWLVQPQAVQHGQPVGLEQDAGADGADLRGPFEQCHLGTGSRQQDRGGHPADSGADHGTHVFRRSIAPGGSGMTRLAR
jgi:hypothetical protein